MTAIIQRDSVESLLDNRSHLSKRTFSSQLFDRFKTTILRRGLMDVLSNDQAFDPEMSRHQYALQAQGWVEFLNPVCFIATGRSEERNPTLESHSHF
jgi:hypothetical protein